MKDTNIETIDNFSLFVMKMLSLNMMRESIVCNDHQNLVDALELAIEQSNPFFTCP